jgi:hypothetical protein
MNCADDNDVAQFSRSISPAKAFPLVLFHPFFPAMFFLPFFLAILT